VRTRRQNGLAFSPLHPPNQEDLDEDGCAHSAIGVTMIAQAKMRMAEHVPDDHQDGEHTAQSALWFLFG
jgi:hypothetical protein